MTPIEAFAILQSYQHVAYKSRAAIHVVAQAHKVLSEYGREIMERETGGLCTKCWGDGWARPRPNILNGPCEACDGSGRIEDQKLKAQAPS